MLMPTRSLRFNETVFYTGAVILKKIKSSGGKIPVNDLLSYLNENDKNKCDDHFSLSLTFLHMIDSIKVDFKKKILILI